MLGRGANTLEQVLGDEGEDEDEGVLQLADQVVPQGPVLQLHHLISRLVPAEHHLHRVQKEDDVLLRVLLFLPDHLRQLPVVPHRRQPFSYSRCRSRHPLHVLPLLLAQPLHRRTSSSSSSSRAGRARATWWAQRRLRTRFSKRSTKEMRRVVKTSPIHFLMSEATHSSRLQSRICLRYIDSNYYRMIKATVRMKKENTRKNYQFQRAFKRAKYSSRDQILAEIRFEASFSVLFATKMCPSNSQALPSSGLNQTEASSKRLFRTFHASTNVSFKRREASQKTAGPVLRKLRSGLWEEKEGLVRLTVKLKIALDCS